MGFCGKWHLGHILRGVCRESWPQFWRHFDPLKFRNIHLSLYCALELAQNGVQINAIAKLQFLLRMYIVFIDFPLQFTHFLGQKVKAEYEEWNVWHRKPGWIWKLLLNSFCLYVWYAWAHVIFGTDRKSAVQRFRKS